MGGLVSGPKTPPPPPPPPPPTPMPLPEGDPEVEAARRRSVAEQKARSGRPATILSEGGTNETLGGG